MEPPLDSFYSKGVWHYRPASDIRWVHSQLLTRSEFVRDYDLCIDGKCRPMSDWIPVSAGNTTMTACKTAVSDTQPACESFALARTIALVAGVQWRAKASSP